MRVYLPTTMVALSRLVEQRTHPGGRGCAVTPGLREWYASGDDEELEYAALSRAARLSIELLADEVTAPRRRVVLAADIADGDVQAADEPDADPAEVWVRGDVPMRLIGAVHVDDAASVPLVRAVLVDPDDEMAQGDLEDAELLWYATQEIDQLLGAGGTA